jgi:hypothetical protein
VPRERRRAHAAAHGGASPGLDVTPSARIATEATEGGYTVGCETYTADADLTPLFKGLPDDRCQCPHWGKTIEVVSRNLEAAG